MTDRLKGLVVLFDQPIREDDAEKIINAIRCIQHVAAVNPCIDNIDSWMAQTAVRIDLEKRIFAALRDPVIAGK